MILSGNTLYGTTTWGGTWTNGTLFAVRTDGSGFTNLYSFTGGDDGANPQAGLILSGNTLYGTTPLSGSLSNGTVFAIQTDGSGFRIMHNFTGSDGSEPNGPLILDSNLLYGTTQYSGPSGSGTVFAIHTDGSAFRNLYSFADGEDGGLPQGALVLSGNTLYGTTFTFTRTNFTTGYGTAFALNTDGSGFRTLHWFTGGRDGRSAEAGLMLSGQTLYGTTVEGGSDNLGTVFAVNTDDSGFTNLYDFTGFIEGSAPVDGLILSGNTLYGTTAEGGTNIIGGIMGAAGAVFSIHTDGTSFTTLHQFAGGAEGYSSWTGLTPAGSVLYGTTRQGVFWVAAQYSAFRCQQLSVRRNWSSPAPARTSS